MSVNSKMTALMDAIRSKAGISGLLSLDTAKTAVDSIQTGITPSGSITLTSENTYDVTDKASAVVDFSATRANLAEAVTAKGVDTLPTSSFDTIATNIGLISGGGISVREEHGSFTPATNQTSTQTIKHTLGAIPDIIVFYPITSATLTATRLLGGYSINARAAKLIFNAVNMPNVIKPYSGNAKKGILANYYGTNGTNSLDYIVEDGSTVNHISATPDSSTIAIYANSSRPLQAGIEIGWKAIVLQE